MVKSTLVSGLWLGMVLSPTLVGAESVFEFDEVPAGSSGRPTSVKVVSSKARPLSSEQIKSLLSRLAPLKSSPSDKQDFVLRASSLAPPKAGQRLDQPFPPLQSQPVVEAEKKDVEVVRVAPEGDVGLAPNLSMTFNQPMVALSSTASPSDLPVKLTPQVAGQWRWVGTQTLVFQPETRLPMATNYRAEISQATSIRGTTLKAPVAWSFKTPPPKLQQSYPSGSGQKLNPVLFLAFDQAVDAAQVASFVRLQASDQSVALRQASEAELAADARVQRLSKSAQPGRWVALVPQAGLAPATTYVLAIPQGLPSVEGPLTTTAPQSFSFSTFAPLKVSSRSDREQTPGSPLWIYFNNPLDVGKFRPESIRVTPELPGFRVSASGQSISIRGRTQGRTRYTVTLPASLSDVHGQTMGSATELEFQIGSARPMFVAPPKKFLILDPAGAPQLSFRVINHPGVQVKVYSVSPQDWGQFTKLASRRQPQEELKFPGKLVVDTELPAQAGPDQIQELKLDLREALAQGSNQLVVHAYPADASDQEKRYRGYIGWVQSSQLGVNLSSDGTTLTTWVNRLADGRRVSGARVQLEGADPVTTATDGVATQKWTGKGNLVITQGNDRLFLPGNHWNAATPSQNRVLWYVTDDRKLYKPGETVSVKGWMRTQVQSQRGGLQIPPDKTLHFSLFDSRGNEVSKGKTSIGALGGFDFAVPLPKEFNLGQSRLELKSDNSRYQHRFEVQEFRRPEFEVSSQAVAGSTVVGSSGTVSVEAKYYAGGGLKDAPVNWSVQATPTNYSPPHWEGFSFGTWTPWWDCDCWWSPTPKDGLQQKSFVGKTDHQGRHELTLEFRQVDPPRPHNVQATAAVSDVNRQTWTTTTQLLVHPSHHYVGIRPKSTFVQPGKPLEYQVIVADLDGKAVAGRPVRFKVWRMEWEAGGAKKHEVFSQQLTSASTPLEVLVPVSEGGTYQVEAMVTDASNRSNQSQLTSWVAGGKQPPRRDVEMQSLTLVPNKRSYQPGEVAEILVQSPLQQAQAMVTLERHGLVERQMLDLSKGSATLRIPLERAFMPNLHLVVEAVGQEPRSDDNGNPVAGAPPRPAQARASLNLEVSAQSRQLQVEVRAQNPRSEPGAQNQLHLTLKDAQGRPVAQGEVALFVVDESVLALIGGDYQDPWKLFYSLRPSGVVHDGVRKLIQLALPEEVESIPRTVGAESRGESWQDGESYRMIPPGAVPAPQMRMAKSASGGEAPAEPAPAIRVRKDFSALAYYAPKARTDSLGRLQLPFKLPDNLTRYRIVAIAVGGAESFGKGQSSLVARQPLMVRPSPPRFLNFGDQCQLPVLVQNQTDKALQVNLACRTSNLKIEQSGYSVQVPANDRVEVRFPVSAQAAGTARFQVAASSGQLADAAELDFPVWTPATTEAFATYGVLDDSAVVQSVAPPKDIFPQFGGLEVSTSSSALQELTDAFLYLRSYPYECAEQISSRVLSTVALAPVLKAFEAPDMPTESQLKLSLQADVKKLEGMQNSDGGWDYWKRDRPSVPYVSLHVAHSLARLRNARYAVNEGTWDRALRYVASIENRIPSDYSPSSRRSLEAYAVYVLRLAGRADVARARKLISDSGGVEKTALENLGWILPTLSKDTGSQELVAQIRRHLNNRVSESAGLAQFTTSYQDDSHLILASAHRDDAILLAALIQDQPKSDLLPKLVRGLLAHRVRGRWSNTQENCFVLLALNEYFQTFEKVTPDFVARLWLGGRFAGEQSFRGRSADTKELRVPMGQLRGQEDLILSKSGPGRLYYRLGMKYAPTSLKMEPMERGFSVARSYEAVEDNRDVRRGEDGIWRIKAGARVKVKVTMVAPTMRYHVALVDPLPAGLESINPVLQSSQEAVARPVGGVRWWWNPRWYDHENLRDERTEAFTSWLYYGAHEYSYYARATTPGNFVVPPAKAEEMYHPETFGRSASDRVIVEP